MKDQEVIDLLKSEIEWYHRLHPVSPTLKEALKCIRRLTRKVKRLKEEVEKLNKENGRLERLSNY